MHVIRGWVFGRRTFEVESERLTLFNQREITGTDESGSPADCVIENDGAEFAVGEVFDFFPRPGFGSVRHFAQQSDHEFSAALIGEFENADANAVSGGAASAKIGNEHRGGTQSIHRIELEKIVA